METPTMGILVTGYSLSAAYYPMHADNSPMYAYPPDVELLATENVLKQAELLADEWAA